MLRLSKKTDYGLLALSYLATEAPAGVASARVIAEKYEIPVELLAKVLQHLARLGLVAAQKGAHGGYKLARPASTISLADIVEAIDGPLAITACGRNDEPCDQYGSCTVRDPLWKVRDRILTVLQTTTLAEMGETDGRVPVTVSVDVGQVPRRVARLRAVDPPELP